MCVFEQAVETGLGLTEEERSLLSVAYKNAIDALRSSWRVISSVEQEAVKGSQNEAKAREYRERVEKVLRDSCKYETVCYRIISFRSLFSPTNPVARTKEQEGALRFQRRRTDEHR